MIQRNIISPSPVLNKWVYDVDDYIGEGKRIRAGNRKIGHSIILAVGHPRCVREKWTLWWNA